MRKSKNRYFFLTLLLISFVAIDWRSVEESNGHAYYLNASGNDQNKGTKDSPWKTIEKLNSLSLRAGDIVYFNAGDTFPGTVRIDSTEAGIAGKPIVLTSYGSSKAIIQSGNFSGLSVNKTQHVLVNNLSFIGAGRKNGNTQNGVAITHCRKITVDSLDISGYQKAGLFIYCSSKVGANYVNAFDNGAAGIDVSGAKAKEDCRNISIRYCTATNNAGDPTNLTNHSGNGIVAGVCKNVLIEYSTATNNGWDMPRTGNGPVGIWTFESDSVTIQYCISYRNKTSRGGEDGGGFDLDGGVTNSVIQYCLSYENHGSGFGIFQYNGASPWYNNVIRYSISENDGSVSSAHAGVYIWNGSRDEKQLKDCLFYNNVIYNTTGAAISYALENENSGFRFFNNIFVAKDELVSRKEPDGIFIANNWWSLSGNLKGKVAGYNIDPQFKNPGNTSLVSPALLEAYSNYQLPSQSLLLRNGIDLSKLFRIKTSNRVFGKKPGKPGVIGACVSEPVQKSKSLIPGGVWKDDGGDFINAHGGGIMLYNGTYYWFGEIKKGATWKVPYVTTWEDYRVKAGGVSCYSSKDLLNWKFEGVALASNTTDSTHDLHFSKVIERPKVIFNKRTGKFVMWMHVDAEDYSYSQAGVAVSDHPAGPYRYVSSVKPGGAMSRDMTVFEDDNDKAYLIFASENNATMHVCLLADDYLSPSTQCVRILEDAGREAPAMFKYQGKYYLITSDCTGWSSNGATWAIAESPLGPWKQHDNPCKGKLAETTFRSQSTFVIKVPGSKDSFIFMADRWNKYNLEDSRYIWLPLFMKNGKPEIKWISSWSLSN